MEGRHVVITVNNWTEEIYEKIYQFDWEYIVIGKEVGKEGTPHLQCYGVFKKKRRYAQLAKDWKASFATARGTPQQASDYCKKDGDWVEKGELPPTQGTQGGQATKDLWARINVDQEFMLQKIEDGTIKAFQIPSIVKGQLIYKALKYKADHLDSLSNLWLCGPSGYGKTRLADHIAPTAYTKSCNKWWDGYQFEEVVIINDFGKEHSVLGHHMKLWGEHRPFQAEVKGGQILIRPKRVIVTSQYTIDDIWEDEETRSAIRRRYKAIKFLGKLTIEEIIDLAKKL